MEINDAYVPILARLAELTELRGAKIREHSLLLKAAATADWEATATENANAVLEEAQALQLEEDELITAAERMLAEEGYSLPDEPPKPRESFRLWRKDLTTEEVSSTRTVEEVLDNRFDKLLSKIPVDWFNEQTALRASADDNYLLEPIALYGNIRATSPPVPIHRFAYALMLAQDCRNARDMYDMYEGSLLVPLIVTLCASLDALNNVKGGPERLREIIQAPSAEVDSRLYELAVAARAAFLGRDIEFLPQVNEITPDLRIHDLGFPAVAECKMQQRLSAYEIQEFSAMREVFQLVRAHYQLGGIIGNFAMQLRASPREIGIHILVNAAIECQGGLNPYRRLDFVWGSVSLSPLLPTIFLPGATRLYSPDFLEYVFGWHVDTTEYDGICAAVRNHGYMRVAQAELPLCLQWRVEHSSAIDRKARSLASQLAEAHNQIPVGEAGFLYLAYEESHRNAIADRRTERLLELVTKWELRKRGINPQRIIVNRLYPRAVKEGRPDLIENAIQISRHGEDVWFGKMPSAVFTAPSTLNEA